MERIKRFRNRVHAGIALARKFRRYKDAENTIVGGLARDQVSRFNSIVTIKVKAF